MTSAQWQFTIPTLVSKVYLRPRLPYVIVGGLKGRFWVLGVQGGGQEKGFTHTLEITHIDAFQDEKRLLVGVDNRLFFYNLDTDERHQLLTLDSKISCIFLDEPAKTLYVGLWSNVPGKPTLLAYEFDGDSTLNPLWSKATGDIVRSIYVTGGLDSRNILVGSENKSVLYLDSAGQVLDTFEALNRITKLRVFSRADQLRIIVLSDASDLQVLQLHHKGFSLEGVISLDSRPKNAFFYSQNSDIYLVGITTSSLYVFELTQHGLQPIWQGDTSHTLMKSLYWWPATEGHDRFLIERRDSTLACYEFHDDRPVHLFSSILQEETQLDRHSLADEYITTKERVYSVVYLPETQHLYAVTGNGRLVRVLVDVRYHIAGNLRMDSVETLYSNPEDRLRTVVVAHSPENDLIFFGGESGIVYRYNAKDRVTSMTPSLGEWIYDAVLIRSRLQQSLLVLSEHGLQLYDTELHKQESMEIETDILRCMHWDRQTGEVYVGSETGYVYEVGVLSPTLTDTIGWSSSGMTVIFNAERKVRCIRSVHTEEAHILIIGSEDGLLYAIDATTGKALWSYPFEQWVRRFEPVMLKGKIVAIAIIGRKQELDLVSIDDGKLVSRHKLPYEPRSISVFEHLDRVGMAVTGLESNLYLYTVQFKRGQILLRRSSQKITKVVAKMGTILTRKNIIRFLIALASLIAVLANIAQILDFLSNLWAAIKGLLP